MDWAPAVVEARAQHDEACAEPGCDWLYCALTPPVPEVARRLGLVEVVVTLAEQAARFRVTTEHLDRPELRVLCLCGCIRHNHSVDGQRCYRHATCQADGGFRPEGS